MIKNDISNILVERYSFIVLALVILNRGKIRVNKVGMIDFFPNHTTTLTFWERIGVKLYGFNHTIDVPNYSDNFKSNSQVVWNTHQEALQYLEKFKKGFKNHSLGKYLVTTTDSENILIAAQKEILHKISKKILLLKVYEHFSRGTNKIDRVVFDDYDRLFFEEYVKPNKSKIACYKITKLINLLKCYTFSLVYLIFSPLMFREILRRGIRVKKIVKKEFDVGIHMAFGFQTQQNIKEAKMRKGGINLNDALLIQRGRVSADKTAFIYSRWSFSNKNKTYFNKIIDKMGSTCIDENSNKISINVLFKYLKNYASLLSVYFLSLFKFHFYPLWFVHDMHKLINNYFMHIVFCDYYRIKIFVNRDDYDSQHIIRTICQNKYNLKNVGIQHSAFCDYHKVPHSAHVYFDTYYTMGDGYQKLWHPYWNNNKKLVSAGPHRDFCVQEAAEDRSIKERYNSKYHGKITVLMLVSKDDKSNSPFWLLNKKYKELYSFLELDSRLHLIIRPRNIESIDTIFNICPELHHYVEDDRCTVELYDFTTQELMPYVDILVSEDSSSSLLESLTIENLFSIFFMVRYVDFSKIKDMVVHDSNELKDMIHSFLNQDIQYEKANKQRDRIRKEFVTQPMGFTWERIGADINQTLDEWDN